MERATTPADPAGHTVLSLLGAAAGHLHARGFDEARLHAEYLLAHVLGLDRLGLYLQFDRPLTPHEVGTFRSLFRRRLSHEPLQYILGETGFMGLRIAVNPDVLIPRPETELLVERALAFAAERPGESLRILDACTGSGNIAVAIAHFLPGATVTAFDSSAEALRTAGINAERIVPGRVTLVEADLFREFLPGRSFDLILSNPPYIPAEEFSRLDPEVRVFEPRLATTDDGDGFRFHRRLALIGSERLTAGGALMLEVGYGQAAAVASLMADAGLTGLVTTADSAGIPRVVEGRRP